MIVSIWRLKKNSGSVQHIQVPFPFLQFKNMNRAHFTRSNSLQKIWYLVCVSKLDEWRWVSPDSTWKGCCWHFPVIISLNVLELTLFVLSIIFRHIQRPYGPESLEQKIWANLVKWITFWSNDGHICERARQIIPLVSSGLNLVVCIETWLETFPGNSTCLFTFKSKTVHLDMLFSFIL